MTSAQHGPFSWVHSSAYERMRGFRDKYLDKSRPLKVLDLGSCSHSQELSHRNLFEQAPFTYTGVDLVAGPNVDIVLRDPYAWSELPDQSFDVVVSGQVFEHIEFPWLTMLEVSRVLRPGGMLCVIVPSSGRIHRAPVDCWRFHPDGLIALAKSVHMRVHLSALEWQPPHAQLERNIWRDAVLVAEKLAPSTATDERVRRAHEALTALRHLTDLPSIASDVQPGARVFERVVLAAQLEFSHRRRVASDRGRKWLKRNWKKIKAGFT